MHAHTCTLASRRVCITGEAAPARRRTSRPPPPHRRRTSRRGWAATPTCTPWACRRCATLQRELPCCTPCHAAPLAMLHAARPHRAAPCQASYKLSKELHDTHKSCTEHWVNLATQACAGGGLHQVGLVSMGQTHMLRISPYISLDLPVPAYISLYLTRWATSRWARSTCSCYASPTSPTPSPRSRPARCA